MTEDELDDTFSAVFDAHMQSLDLDYINKFMARVTNNLIYKHGNDEVLAVFENRKANQNIENDLRWILEVGSLMIIFQFQFESSDLRSVQHKLIAILYKMNKNFANELVSHKILPSQTNILFSYSDLATVLEGSQQIYLKFCCDPHTQKLRGDAKSSLFSNYFDMMAHLVAR